MIRRKCSHCAKLCDQTWKFHKQDLCRPCWKVRLGKEAEPQVPLSDRTAEREMVLSWANYLGLRPPTDKELTDIAKKLEYSK